jgi:hypothetical protein
MHEDTILEEFLEEQEVPTRADPADKDEEEEEEEGGAEDVPLPWDEFTIAA